MRLLIEVNVEFPEDMEEFEREWLLTRIGSKINAAREALADPRLVCTAPEDWNQLRRWNGQQIGTLTAKRVEP